MNKWALRTVMISGLIAGSWLLFTGTSHALSAEESCFTSKINGARSSNLSVNSELVSIARRHSQRMANSGTIYHNGNLANEAPDGWQSLGENVGMGPTCDDIHNAFMNSASHRKNILDPDFNFVGVGVVITSDGTIFVTEVFMQASQPAPSQPAPTKTSNTTTTTTTKSSTPKTTTTKKTTASAPAQVAEPPPPPPPPPGSKVKGQTTAYMSRIESEVQPSAEEQAAYDKYREESETEKSATSRKNLEQAEKKPGILARIFSFIAAVFSGNI